jgi:hypothetical protein
MKFYYSSPHVVQVNEERLEIGRFYCRKEDGCTQPQCPMPECNRPNIIGSICTDLWWYCAVDKSEFEKRIGKTVDQYAEDNRESFVSAKVTPGTYRAVGQYHIDSNKLYSFIEKIK